MESTGDGEMPPVEVDPHIGSRMAAQRKDEASQAKEKRDKELRYVQRKHPTDWVARVRELKANGLIDFADVTKGDDDAVAYKYTEMNLHRLFDAMFIGGAIGDAHCDLSRRAIVDETGKAIDDIWAPRRLLDAVQVCKLKSPHGISSDKIIKTFRTWALTHQFNDITERIRNHLETVPPTEVVDQTLDKYLIDTLGMIDNEDNRAFSKYWCLALYSRMMYPGSLAPISMAMFGAQDAGKSHFQRMVCRELLFDQHAAPVTFDPLHPNKELFRDIHGISIIATIPEMSNFKVANVRKLKAVLTDTTDTFDQKYGFSSRCPRQYIFVLDGNRYAGLWRDNDDEDAVGETRGERRWFPVFVGQTSMEGEVRWSQDFVVDFGETFAPRLWSMMKSAQQWFEEHGMEGYVELVKSTTNMVKEFSRREKEAGEGVVKDDNFDERFPQAVYRTVRLNGWIGEIYVLDSQGRQFKVRGLCIKHSDVMSAFADLKQSITPKRITMTMKQIEGVRAGFIGVKKMKLSGFVFVDPETFSDPEKFSDGQSGADEFCALFCEKYLPWAVNPAEAWMTSSELVRRRSSDDF